MNFEIFIFHQQKIKRASGNLTDETLTLKNSSKKLLLKNNKKEKPIVLDDDEAMLEPDYLPVSNTSDKHHHQPTDIADIIADSVGEEQRFSPSFHPNSGPYGGRITPTVAPVSPTQPSSTSFRSRRPSLFSSTKNNRQNQRTPFVADNFNEFVDGENSLLGSGNFDVLGGGVFRDTIDYQRPYVNNPPPQYFPPGSPSPPPIIQSEIFRTPQQPFFPSNHPSPPPVGDQFGAFIPPIKTSINNNNNNKYANIPNFPSSFFNDDDFFSNFRDFADVNQDYRNK